ncbi:hypothetical protein NKH91_13160 [Mesorhizobium sp. M0894]|uniref:hypothetical protein n=1 Tax=unclassified Mesorhizobium TaxID=325217 RepID=UPI0033362ED6
MSLRVIGLLALAILLFVVVFLVIIIEMGTLRRPPGPKPREILAPFDGQLYVLSLDDLRVGPRKIVLCGVTFSKPQSMRPALTLEARRYQGLALTCKPVGSGTPCDGNVAPKFRDAVVVQCLTSDGTDLAAKLVEAGILCGQPAQAGSTYKSCLPGS